MVETVKVITEWALSMEGVCAVEAETDLKNDDDVMAMIKELREESVVK